MTVNLYKAIPFSDCRKLGSSAPVSSALGAIWKMVRFSDSLKVGSLDDHFLWSPSYDDDDDVHCGCHEIPPNEAYGQVC